MYKFLKKTIFFLLFLNQFNVLFPMDPSDVERTEETGLSSAVSEVDESPHLDVEGDECLDLETLTTRFDVLRENHHDVKGVMLLMVLQEHILETYLAEKIAAKEGIDTCAFDERLKLFFKFEQETFDRLSPDAQALWASFEERFATIGTCFNFPAIRSWFKERNRFRDTCYSYLDKVIAFFNNIDQCSQLFLFLEEDGGCLFKHALVKLAKTPTTPVSSKTRVRDVLDRDGDFMSVSEQANLRAKTFCSLARGFCNQPLWTERARIFYLDAEIFSASNFGFKELFDCAYEKIDAGKKTPFSGFERVLLELRPVHDAFTGSMRFMERFCNLLPTVIQKAYEEASSFRAGYRALYEKLCCFLGAPFARIVSPGVFCIDRSILLPRRIFMLHDSSQSVCESMYYALARVLELTDKASESKVSQSGTEKCVSYHGAPSVFFDYWKTCFYSLGGPACDETHIAAVFESESLFDTIFFDIYHAIFCFSLWTDGVSESLLNNTFCVKMGLKWEDLETEVQQRDDGFMHSCLSERLSARGRLVLKRDLRVAESLKILVQNILRIYPLGRTMIADFFERNPLYPPDLLPMDYLFVLDMELIPVFRYYKKILEEKIAALEQQAAQERKLQVLQRKKGEVEKKQKRPEKRKTISRRRRTRGCGCAVVQSDREARDILDQASSSDTVVPCEEAVVEIDDGAPASVEISEPMRRVFQSIVPSSSESRHAASPFETLVRPLRDNVRAAIMVLLYEDKIFSDDHGVLGYRFIRKECRDIWHREAVDAALECLNKGIGEFFTKDSIDHYNDLFNDGQRVFLREDEVAIVIEAKIGNYSARRLFETDEHVSSWRGDHPFAHRRDIHSGAFVFIFNTQTHTCFHQCFHEFKQSYAATHLP